MHSRPQLALPAWGLFAAALLLWAGCKTTTYVLQVDAISQAGQVAQKTREPQSYKVHSHNPRLPEDTLRYNEVAQYIKTALSGKGLYEAPSDESADLIIEIDYGMETPRMKYQTVTSPVFVTQNNTMPEPASIAVRTTPSAASAAGGPRSIATQQMNKIVGWKQETEPIVVYEKYLKVSARENRDSVEGRPAPEVWSVNVSAEDRSNELRKYMPILASATADYIDTNTRQEKAVTVSENDETVKFIKKGM